MAALRRCLPAAYLTLVLLTLALPLPAQDEESARRALNTSETGTERHRREIAEEASSELFNMGLGDSEVSLFMSGYWKASLSLNWGFASSPLGAAPQSNDSPLLFTQEADLTLSLWLRERWFLEVSFLDDYDLNTYRAGYQGLPGETIQYVGVGNTGLDFPVFPYLDLGGDSKSSFGAYGRFGSETTQFHALIRYDAAAREERTFVGDRERSYSSMTPDNPLRGRSFVLPKANIAGEVRVYFEDKDGPFSGGGKRWRLARASEYAVSSREGILELVRQPSGMAAVYYEGGGGYALGTYTGGTGTFLGDVQNYFGSTLLTSYPQPGGSIVSPQTVLIGGQNALVIYEPGTFSPFERQSRYQAPSDSTSDAALIRLSTGERISGYELLAVNTLGLSLDLSLYTLTGDSSSRGIYELFQAGTSDRRSPESRWPLDLFPEIYLPGKQSFTEDFRIRFTNYGPAGAYNIGTDVVPGSVQVYRGGIMDSQVSFDPVSGTVTLASPVGFNEVIRISYLKRSEDRRLGSLAAGVGITHYDAEKPVSWEAALGLRWNISQEAYTEEGAASPGTVGFGGKIAWDYEKIRASVSLGLGYEQPDTTGLYRVAGMEGNSEIVMGVSTGSGFISEAPVKSTRPITDPDYFDLGYGTRNGLVYRNYRKADMFGSSSMENIDWSAPVVSGMEGPYPARDAGMDIFAAEFDEIPVNYYWTGFEVPLGADSGLLERAKGIVVPMRFYQISGHQIQVVMQFGSLAAEGSVAAENPSLIVEQEVYNGSVSSIPGGWINNGNVIIHLNEEMRRKLQNATHLRVIVINTSSSQKLSGRVLVAKPYVMGASWRAITINSSEEIRAADDSTSSGLWAGVRVAEVRSDLHNSRIDKLHSSGANFVLQTEWENKTSPFSAGADGRTAAIPLSTYRTLSFYIKGNAFPDGSTFHFVVSRGPDSWGDPNRTALQVDLPNAAILNGGWRLVEIEYTGNRRVRIDGNEYPASIHYRSRALRENSGDEDFAVDGRSGYIAAFFEAPAAVGGSFYIDEICLEDPAPAYRVNAGTTLEWNHSEALIKSGDRDVLSVLSFNTALETSMRGDPFTSDAENFAGFQSRSTGGFTLFDTKITGRLSLTNSNDLSWWSAGHGISRAFGKLGVSESFDSSPQNEMVNHDLSFSLSTLLHAQGQSKIYFEHERLRRNWNASAGVTPVLNGHPGFSLEGNVAYLEKNTEITEWLPNYAETWTKSWLPMLPDRGKGFSNSVIQSRDAGGKAGFSVNRTPLGADLSFEGTSFVSLPLESTQSRSTGRVDLPFTAGPVKGVLRTERTFRRTVFYAGSDLNADMIQWKDSLEDSGPLWAQLPVYALFSSRLDDAMDRTISSYDKNISVENSRFGELLSLSLVFPERYDLASLVVPVNFQGQIDRTMEQRLDTRIDVLTYTASLGFSAINLFGAMGSYPKIKLYQNDELRHSIAGVFSFPKNEDPVWRVQAEQNLGFWGFKGAELSLTNTFTASTPGWTEGAGLYWNIPREKTLLGTLYKNGMNKIAGKNYLPAINDLAASEHERIIRESFEFYIERLDDYTVYSFMLGHESVVRVLGKLTLTGFAKVSFDHNTTTKETAMQLSCGTTLMVTF
ncbi:MAG: hypothetical protein LBB82_05570 [Treponema sp.]|jgi:hypothetical protein|nr:hypothetical protein [Treponema sp.]